MIDVIDVIPGVVGDEWGRGRKELWSGEAVKRWNGVGANTR